MTIIRVRETDDLELVPCTTCIKGKLARERCSNCHGTGDRVVHRVKYFEIRITSKQDRRLARR